MNLSSVRWNGHEAIKIISGYCELIIGTSLGPRILSLKYGNGNNLLYEDATGFGVGEWRLYGGHRFTIAPETESSYYPDNEVCSVNTTEETVIIAAPLRTDGLRLSIKVSEASKGRGFELHHILENHGNTTWTGALWAITCVPRSSYVEASCSTNNIHYWPGTDSANWLVSEGFMYVRPGDFRGKTGWHESQGWLSAKGAGAKLIIHHHEETAAADCVDDGCNLEIFACKDWIELETLGKRLTVPPGGSAQHLQHWLLSDDRSLVT